MKVRKEKKGEITPNIYMKEKPIQEFDPDFFIVNIVMVLLLIK